MEKSLSIEENKTFDKVRNKRWYLPLLFYLMCLICFAGIVISKVRLMFDVPILGAVDALYIGGDILGIAICIALLRGCITGRDSSGDMTYLFASMIFSNGVLLFFDECIFLLEGIRSLRVLNNISNAGLFIALPLLIYFFWRYVRLSLNLDNYLKVSTIKILQIGIIPLELMSILSIFFPVFFKVNEDGSSTKGRWCLAAVIYVAVVAVAILRGMKLAKISRSHSAVIKMFFLVPFFCSLLALPLFGATLFSIILLYVVIYTEKSNALSATQSELSTATNIQLSSLPRRFPKKKEFKLFATMTPAKEVGGDFYDFFNVDKDHVALVAADVSGKGVPAALFMMRAKAIIKSLAGVGMNPAKVLSDANAAIMENNDEDMFVTVWLGILEISTGILTYADAGHEKLLVRRNGKWEILQKQYTGFALGTIDSDEIAEMPEKNQYVDVQLQLNQGDIILQYTDGVTEATNSKNQLFGEERLLEAVNSSATDEPKELLEYIRDRIDEFVAEAPQFDDLTMLAIKYTGVMPVN